MEEFTLMQIALPKEFDLQVQEHLRKLKSMGVRYSKSELAVKFMRVGYLKESAELLNEERAEK